MSLHRSLYFLVIALVLLMIIPQQAVTQIQKRTIPLESGRDLLIQIEGGLGYSQYSFGQDDKLLETLDKQYDLDGSDLSAGPSFHFGTSVFNRDTGLRLRLSIRSELINSKSSGMEGFFNSFNFFQESGTGDFLIEHRLQTVSIHLERLFSVSVKNSELNYGFGGFFGWVNDTRREALSYKTNGSEKIIKDILNIEGRVAGVSVMVGRYFENKIGYFEVRPGYQFHISRDIKKKPASGKSSDGYQPSFEMLYVSLVVGLTL